MMFGFFGSVWIGVFSYLVYQIQLVASGMTGNEVSKWNILKNHKEALKVPKELLKPNPKLPLSLVDDYPEMVEAQVGFENVPNIYRGTLVENLRQIV